MDFKTQCFDVHRHSILISSGYGDVTEKVLRFTAFGNNAEPVKVDKLIMAMKDALDSSETNL